MTRLVVIVEDAESVAASLAVALERIPDVKALVTNHPHAALAIFNQGGMKVAALITDLNLPGLDGFELISRIRTMDGYRNLPAIMITAQEHLSQRNGNPLRNPDRIFKKPFSIREVCRALEALL